MNDRYVKQILLFLSKERHKECTRTEISDHLGGKLSNDELEEKLCILKHGDLIAKGINNFRYSGIADDILDLLFRELYQEGIEQVKPDISKERMKNWPPWNNLPKWTLNCFETTKYAKHAKIQFFRTASLKRGIGLWPGDRPGMTKGRSRRPVFFVYFAYFVVSKLWGSYFLICLLHSANI